MTEHEVQYALLSGDPQDQLVIAYNLVIDNKRIADESKGWLLLYCHYFVKKQHLEIQF